MREGIGFDKTEYYLKTDNGLWLKGWVDLSLGTINIAHQNRIVFTKNKSVAVLNEVGDPTSIISMSNTELPSEWTVCGSISLDGSSWSRFLRLAEKHGHNGADLHHRVLVHAIRLGANGWGDGIGDPLSWFADPFATPFMVHDKYCVDLGGGAFEGLEGLVFEPAFDEDRWSECVENTVTCELFYDGRKVEIEASVFDLIYFCSPVFVSA